MAASPATAPTPTRQLWHRLVVGALALAAVAWWQYPDGTLQVIFPALPGDAVIIRTPGGAALVIDGGGDPAALTAALGRALPFWQREVAALILTTDDARDLVSHIALLERYQVRQIYVATPPADSATATAWWTRIREQRREPQQLRDDCRLILDGVTLTCARRGAALVIALAYGGTGVVLAHRVAADAAPLAQGTPATLLSYPWVHDPRNAFVAQLAPQVLVFSDGLRTRPVARLSYAARGMAERVLCHERIDGSIHWSSDGRRWRLLRTGPDRDAS
jgi:hypothetical protein